MPDRCLLLLARNDDPAVATLRQHAPHRLVHAEVADLSGTGWRYVSGRPDLAIARAEGRTLRANDVAAVVCRIDAVRSSDLPHVHRHDREYIAAELNAFLRAWLVQFTGVRFNEPTWASLAGASWHALQWTWLVAQAGVPVVGFPMDIDDRAHETMTATVVGEQVFGIGDRTLMEYSLRIAAAVKSKLLAVRFAYHHGWKFLSADPCPTLGPASAAALVRRAFERVVESPFEPLPLRSGGSCVT